MAIAFNGTEQQIIGEWITSLKDFPGSELIFINNETDIDSQLFNDAQEMIDSAESFEKHERITIISVMNNNDTPTVYVINNNLI